MGWWCSKCGCEHEGTACPNPTLIVNAGNPDSLETTSDPGTYVIAESSENWWQIRLECIRELGYAIVYMNFLHPYRRVDKPFEDSDGWHSQRIAVQTLCSKLANNQDRDDLEWWKAFRSEISSEIENMC